MAAGQVKISVTGTAVNLPAASLHVGITLTAPASNAAGITVASSSALTNTADGTGNGYILAPGASVAYYANDASVIWINGTGNDYISFLGS